MGLSLYLAKNARLEIQQGAEWWRHPGIRGVTLNQDPTPREEIDTWEGSDAVLGNVPSPTLGYSGQSNFLHRAWLATAALFDGGDSGTYRMITKERARGSAITGAGNTLAVARIGTSKFGNLTLAGSNAIIDAVGIILKQGVNFFIVEDIADPVTGTNGYDGTDSTGEIVVSKYDAAVDDRKAADPTQAPIASYSPVQPALRWGPFTAGVSEYNDVSQEGTAPFAVNFTLSLSGLLPRPVIHV